VIVSLVSGFLVATVIVDQRLNVLMVKLYLLVLGINVNCFNREAEPLDLRYRAEPGNEERVLSKSPLLRGI
jgi:hypothetical protein